MTSELGWQLKAGGPGVSGLGRSVGRWQDAGVSLRCLAKSSEVLLAKAENGVTKGTDPRGWSVSRARRLLRAVLRITKKKAAVAECLATIVAWWPCVDVTWELIEAMENAVVYHLRCTKLEIRVWFQPD